jgi:hypothetical protein
MCSSEQNEEPTVAMLLADNRPLPPHPLLDGSSAMAISPLEVNNYLKGKHLASNSDDSGINDDYSEILPDDSNEVSIFHEQ